MTFSNRIIGRRGVAPAGAAGAPHNPNDSVLRFRVIGSGAGHSALGEVIARTADCTCARATARSSVGAIGRRAPVATARRAGTGVASASVVYGTRCGAGPIRATVARSCTRRGPVVTPSRHVVVTRPIAAGRRAPDRSPSAARAGDEAGSARPGGTSAAPSRSSARRTLRGGADATGRRARRGDRERHGQGDDTAPRSAVRRRPLDAPASPRRRAASTVGPARLAARRADVACTHRPCMFDDGDARISPTHVPGRHERLVTRAEQRRPTRHTTRSTRRTTRRRARPSTAARDYELPSRWRRSSASMNASRSPSRTASTLPVS